MFPLRQENCRVALQVFLSRVGPRILGRVPSHLPLRGMAVLKQVLLFLPRSWIQLQVQQGLEAKGPGSCPGLKAKMSQGGKSCRNRYKVHYSTRRNSLLRQNKAEIHTWRRPRASWMRSVVPLRFKRGVQEARGMPTKEGMYVYTQLVHDVAQQKRTRHCKASMCMPCVRAKRFSCVWLFPTPGTAAHEAPLSTGLSRREYCSGLPCPPPGDLPSSGIKLASLTTPAFRADSWLLNCQGSPYSDF